MSLKEIYCQDKAIGVLERAFASQRLAHAYIFAGRDGVGKFKTATQWAKVLLCKELVNQDGIIDSCGQCESCRLFEAGSHPDFNHIYKELLQYTKEGKNKTTPVEIPIDVIREFLIAKVSQKPTLSRRKVFIISEAEKLNDASQNAILKTLEEPPDYCFIVLLCTGIEKLLPTTKSRCQVIRFSPVTQDRIIGKLHEMGLSETVAKYFARLSQGSLGQACQWGQLELEGANLYELKKNVIECISSYKFSESLELAKKFLAETKAVAEVWVKLAANTSKTDVNRRAQKTVIQIIISALSDAMRLNLDENAEIINFDQPGQIKKLAEQFDVEKAAEQINAVSQATQWIDSSVNDKLIFERLLLNLNISGKIAVKM